MLSLGNFSLTVQWSLNQMKPLDNSYQALNIRISFSHLHTKGEKSTERKVFPRLANVNASEIHIEKCNSKLS